MKGNIVKSACIYCFGGWGNGFDTGFFKALFSAPRLWALQCGGINERYCGKSINDCFI